MEIHPEQARTLAAILTHGSFDAAAAHLSVTPSAISQRVRALEAAVGRPVLTRARPPGLTESGQAVVRFARQLEMLSADLAEELQPGARPRRDAPDAGDQQRFPAHLGAGRPAAAASDNVQLEILREDQEYSLDLLRSGAAAAAITATAKPAPGCSSRRLGVMRYLPVCTPDFAAAGLPAGATGATLAAAPVIVFDRKDDLQDRYLRRVSREPCSRRGTMSRPPTSSAKPSAGAWAGA